MGVGAADVEEEAGEEVGDGVGEMAEPWSRTLRNDFPLRVRRIEGVTSVL